MSRCSSCIIEDLCRPDASLKVNYPATSVRSDHGIFSVALDKTEYSSRALVSFNIINLGLNRLMGICSFVLLLGSYNSVTIRLGDKYDIWSKLEATQPNTIFGILRKKKEKT